ncbi:MAG: hypothetical protein ACK4NS_00685 [Saprospiraceae bacterium]
MKVLIIVGVVILLGALGLVWLVWIGESVNEQIIGEFKDGADKIELKAISASSWGNTYSARALYFNGRLADFRGSMLNSNLDGHKVFPLDARGLRVDILDTTHAETLRQTEAMTKNAAIVEGRMDSNLLQQQHPDIKNGSPWTIWVNPHDFAEAEYLRMIELIKKGGSQLRKDQRAFEQDTSRNPNAWNRYPDLIIWRAVYHDYDKLESPSFVRKDEKTEEVITINHDGGVYFQHKSEAYIAGFGFGLGQLNETADTLYLMEGWDQNGIALSMSVFARFKDKNGRALSEVYRIVPPR